MNASKEQAAVFTALRPGEAVVGLEGHPVPVRVEVDDVVARLGVPLGEVTNLDVKRRMDIFYLKNPLPKDPVKARDARIRELVDTPEFRLEFLGVYRSWLASGNIGPLKEFLLDGGRRTAPEDVNETACQILYLAVGFYTALDAEKRARFPRALRKELEAHPRA